MRSKRLRGKQGECRHHLMSPGEGLRIFGPRKEGFLTEALAEAPKSELDDEGSAAATTEHREASVCAGQENGALVEESGRDRQQQNPEGDKHGKDEESVTKTSQRRQDPEVNACQRCGRKWGGERASCRCRRKGNEAKQKGDYKEPLGAHDAVNAAAVEWRALWKADEPAPVLSWPPVPRIPEPSVKRFRAAVRRFPFKTGLGTDNLHPRWLDELSDQTVAAIIRLLWRAEGEGKVPEAVAYIVIHLIPKRGGGRRPIGIAAGLFRGWAKCRREEVQQWETTIEREYWWGVAGKGCEQCIWEHLVVDEAVAGKGLKTATFLSDVLKCFEQVPWQILIDEAVANSFPLAVLRLSLAIYAGVRRIALDGAYAEEAHAKQSVLAGCVHSTALLRALMLRTLDRIQANWGGIRLRVVVDDISLQTVGTRRFVANTFPAASRELVRSLEVDLKLPVSRKKSAAVISDQTLRCEVKKALQKDKLKVVPTERLLGADFAAGGRRPTKIVKNRIGAVKRRLPRYQALRRGGAKTIGIAKTGAAPALLFATRTLGAPDNVFQQVRANVARAAGLGKNMSSAALGLAIRDGEKAKKTDPAHEMSVGPVVAFATAVWEKSIPFSWLSSAVSAATEAVAKQTRSWKNCKGPIEGMVRTLRRIGWQAASARSIIDDKGATIDLFGVAPSDVGRLVEKGTTRWIWKQLALETGDVSLADGPRLPPLHRLTYGKSSLDPRQKGCVLSTVVGTQWPQQRLHKAGFVESPDCVLCSGGPGTLLHRHALCEATEASRRQYAPSSVVALARAIPCSAQRVFLERLLAPSPVAELPPPQHELTINWEKGPGVFSGACFLDGSGLHTKFGNDFTRCGVGACAIDAWFNVVLACFAALPGDLQSVPGAESMALLAALREAVPPLTLYTDCELVVTHVARGRVWSTAASRPWAGIWHQIWLIIDEEPGFAIKKVKAHRSLAQARAEGQEFEMKGNKEADRLAKKGASLHNVPPEILEATKALDARILEYGAWVGRVHDVLEKWPDTTAKSERIKKASASERRELSNTVLPKDGGHLWVPRAGGKWKCELCSATSATPGKYHNRRCVSALAARVSKARAENPPMQKHRLFQSGPVVFCWRCGRYTSERLRELAGECRDHKPKGGYATIRRRLRQGHDLKTDAFVEQPRPFILPPVAGKCAELSVALWPVAAQHQASQPARPQQSGGFQRARLEETLKRVGLTEASVRRRCFVKTTPVRKIDDASSEGCQNSVVNARELSRCMGQPTSHRRSRFKF